MSAHQARYPVARRTELVLKALNMAIGQRRPQGVIHHSDHGSQHTAEEFGKRCREAGIRPSLGSVGDCYDNALCESFLASLGCGLLDWWTFETRDEARRAVFGYIEGWYNSYQQNLALGYQSSVSYERKFQTEGNNTLEKVGLGGVARRTALVQLEFEGPNGHYLTGPDPGHEQTSLNTASFLPPPLAPPTPGRGGS